MRDFSADHGWLSINTATLRGAGSLEAIIEACARHGIRAISPWRDQVAAIGLERTAALVREHGLALSGYCRGGMFPAIDAVGRQAALDDNRRALDEAKTLDAAASCSSSAPFRRLAGAALTGTSPGARRQVQDAFGDAQYARDVGMPLAIEPLHRCTRPTAPASTRSSTRSISAMRRSGARGASASPSTSIRLVGSEARGADRPRRQGPAARVPRLRLAGEDPRPAEDRGMMATA